MSAAQAAAAQCGKCPICGKTTAPGYRPFCSARCADVDLAHWLRGDYRIPAEPVDPEAHESGSE